MKPANHRPIPRYYDYNASAGVVLGAGFVVAMLAKATGSANPFVGFLFGSVPVFVVAVITHAMRDGQ